MGDLHLPKDNSVDSRSPLLSAFLKLMKALFAGPTRSISRISVSTLVC